MSLNRLRLLASDPNVHAMVLTVAVKVKLLLVQAHPRPLQLALLLPTQKKSTMKSFE
jgi:hypothetical protein